MTLATRIIETVLAIYATGCVIGLALIARSEFRHNLQTHRDARQ